MRPGERSGYIKLRPGPGILRYMYVIVLLAYVHFPEIVPVLQCTPVVASTCTPTTVHAYTRTRTRTAVLCRRQEQRQIFSLVCRSIDHQRTAA